MTKGGRSSPMLTLVEITMSYTDSLSREGTVDLSSTPVLPLRRHEQARAAVIALFRQRDPGNLDVLLTLSSRDWENLLRWLDTSGLALYSFDHLRKRRLLTSLPVPVVRRLARNLLDNTQRTAALVAECCAIQEDFAAAGVSYAVLKGFSLWPDAVPRLELRSQLDLDFLVDTACEARAQTILERRGYRLQAVSGRTREFKTPYAGSLTLDDLYRPSPQRTVEIHLEEQGTGLLHRCERRTVGGVSMPVLSAADLFLDQALHLYKHLSRDQMRTSHMLELYRHLVARSEDQAFWNDVKALCAEDPKLAPCVGLALEFVSQQFGPLCISAAVQRWTIERVPPAARLWVRRYGPRVATASFPGTKLHLLLQEAMAHEGAPVGRSIGASLLPRHLPPSIAIPPAGESLLEAAFRGMRQTRFVLMRLRFHVVEGLRYLCERSRWRRLLHQPSTTQERDQLRVAHSSAATLPTATKS